MWLEELGCSALTVGGGEIYTAAQRGLIEGCRTSVASYISRKLYEVLPFATLDIPCGATVNCIGMSEAAWDSLPSDVQRLMQQSAQDAGLWATVEMTRWIHEEALDSIEDEGATLYRLSPEEVEAFMEQAGNPVRERLASAYGEDLIGRMEEIRTQVAPYYMPTE
jgi:TRAP-type C4-dicarboxylate transport system substrate-binding protein